ncbi:hypothetical protein [Pseudomonas sp. PLMAX]|uniref:hypothetical protein n=1 Tax=Pseudomonas sp. PLMAX TaxID=2201998 RepID=UPI0038B80947
MNVMTQSDSDLISNSLEQWANRIETGDPNLSTGDCKAMGKQVKALGEDQKAFVARLRALASCKFVKQ